MIEQAIIFATKAHKGQLRKVSQSPFIIHPLAVGCKLADVGENEDVVVAGILHDTVEDTNVTLEDIRAEFGDDVAEIVDGCSEDKALTWNERKVNTIDYLKNAPEKVCIVTCADKIHNLLVSVDGIKEEGEDFFVHLKKDMKIKSGIMAVLKTYYKREFLITHSSRFTKKYMKTHLKLMIDNYT